MATSSSSESDTWWPRIETDVKEFARVIPCLDPARLQLTALSFAHDKAHLLQPCGTIKGFRECWLLDCLPEINSCLAPACLEVEETLSAKTVLKSSRSDDEKADNGLLVSCFFAYFLLKNHACIQVLDLHSCQLPVSARHAVEMALAYTRCLEEVDFNLWYQERLGKSRLSENIPELSMLRKLALNTLSQGSNAAAEAIDRNRGIRELEVGGEGLTDKGLRKMLKAIGSCHQLTSLDLNEIRVSPKSARRLSLLLESPSCFLAKLSLYDVTSGVVDAILESLRTNTTLEKLSLSCVRQQGTSALNRVSALKTNRTLRYLQVHECLVDVKELADMLKVNSAVEELGLQVCQLVDEDAVMLAEAIEVNRTLQKLNLQGNRLSRDSVPVFARCLARNSLLQVVDIGYIYFTPDCDETVSSILQETKACGRLLVTWNKAGLLELASVLSDSRVSMGQLSLDWQADTGMSAAIVGIFAALSANTTVTELTIDNGSGVDNAIGEQLALTLKSNTSLKHVSIKNYFRKHAVMIALLEALNDNHTVSTLSFSYSVDSSRVATALCKLLEANSTIYSVDFDGWHLKGKSLLALAAAILRNGVLLEFKLAIFCAHKQLVDVRNALHKNRVVLKQAVRFVTQHSEDGESERAFRTLNGKESLLQALVKVTGKTEPEVKDILNAAAARTLSRQGSPQSL
uniref:Putative ran gtpase-activating protein n=1 Tax=Ixodes ricinus TaxID=34613 RepID=A0A131Y2I0_IXORI